jgi:putative transposase
MKTAVILTGNGCRPTAVCNAMGVPRSTYYRRLKPASRSSPHRASAPVNKLSPTDIKAITAYLHEDRFIDLSPREIVPTLADEGIYLASIRTFYRVLENLSETMDRRLQARHPKRSAPILEATGPNQVWTWDITRLKGPWRGKFFFLYVMLDIFSRYAVGWMLAERENARRAQSFIRQTVEKHIEPGHRLTIHNDRGSPMKAGGTMELIRLLGLEHSFSRPRTSDDNPYSESQFRTLKYHSRFPDWFESLDSGEVFLTDWFRWYNYEHRHTGLNLHTPASVQYGTVSAVAKRRQSVMDTAFELHPERFAHGKPLVAINPAVVGINLMYKQLSVPEDIGVESLPVALTAGEIYTN